MRPTIRSGEQVRVQRVLLSCVSRRQMAVYFSPVHRTLVIHRIIKINHFGKQITFQTKGDAVVRPDPWIVEEEDFIGIATEVKRGGRWIPLGRKKQFFPQISAYKFFDVLFTLFRRKEVCLGKALYYR